MFSVSGGILLRGSYVGRHSMSEGRFPSLGPISKEDRLRLR